MIITKPSGTHDEARYTINDYNMYNSVPSSLFDHNSETFMQFGYNYNYIDITFHEPINFWVMNNINWRYPLTWDVWNGTAFVSSGLVEAPVLNTPNVWQKILTKVPAGRYRIYMQETSNRIDAEWFFEKAALMKSFIIKPDDSAYSYISNTWQQVITNWSSVPSLDKRDLFLSSGMDVLPTPSTIKQLGDPTKISFFTDDTSYYPKIRSTAIPVAKLIIQDSDIALNSIEHVNLANLTAQNVKVIVSTDKGVTWKTWFNNAWENIDSSDLVAIKNNGMTSATMSARIKQDWTDLIGTSKTIRFAYLLDVNASTDICNTDSIIFNVDMKGTWRTAYNNGSIYDCDHPDGSIIRVSLYATGDYKINY